MSNTFTNVYSVPVSSGMINSNQFTQSPGPMTSNMMGQRMQNMPPMSSNIIAGRGPAIGGMNMPPGLPHAAQGLNTGAMHSTMASNMQPGMHQTVPMMQPNVVSGMTPSGPAAPMQYSMVTMQQQVQQGPPNIPQPTAPPIPVEGNAAAVAPARIANTEQNANATQSSRDINTASLCRIGQETVQDIISRTQEIFQTLKTVQAPNGTSPGANAAADRKMKIQDQLRTIRILFKRLRLIYEKCNDNSQLQGMEYTHIESLIPVKDGWDGKSEEKKNSEAYRQATEEHNELLEQVVAKNRVLRDIIEHTRRVIWEINTMLMMRRS